MTEPNESIVAEQHAAAEARWQAAFLAGPTRTTWASLPVQVGDRAPDLALPDTSGATRRLSDWWAGRPLHLLFLRHFGCSCLSERWDTLRTELDELVGAGAAVVAVVQGEPERTAAVAARRGYSLPILCDPSRAAYQAFGLLEATPPQVLHDYPWMPADQATIDTVFAPRRGTERAAVDNPWQLPGDFVIGRDGRIVLAHRHQYCEDDPPKGVLLGAIAAAARDFHPATGSPQV